MSALSLTAVLSHLIVLLVLMNQNVPLPGMYYWNTCDDWVKLFPAVFVHCSVCCLLTSAAQDCTFNVSSLCAQSKTLKRQRGLSGHSHSDLTLQSHTKTPDSHPLPPPPTVGTLKLYASVCECVCECILVIMASIPLSS